MPKHEFADCSRVRKQQLLSTTVNPNAFWITISSLYTSDDENSHGESDTMNIEEMVANKRACEKSIDIQCIQ